MNRIKMLSFVLPLMALLFSSCSLETDNEAGKLEGMWHLVRVETLATGASEDLSNQVIFWSFQAKLLELDDKTGMHNSYLYRFNIDNNQLTLSSPYQFDRENGDRPLTAYEATLNLYGIKKLTPVFRIEKTGKRKMILNDGSVRLYFDKF
ncbi:MAG: lipocalin-like domain-containing protein [Prevotella fusca]|uniref:lipocalin-like domain-containing protein n=1 Tax=Prevotella fusca TaxID=589436 RepID=UPI003F9FA3DC